VALINWIISLGTSGAANNAQRATERRRAEEARVDALLRRLGETPAEHQPAA
jgi:hypothetical protein